MAYTLVNPTVPTKALSGASQVQRQAATTGIAAGHKVPNDGHVLIEVANSGGSPRDITFVTPRTGGAGLAVADLILSITAGQSVIVGPFDPTVFNTDSAHAEGGGYLLVNYHSGSEADLNIRATNV